MHYNHSTTPIHSPSILHHTEPPRAIGLLLEEAGIRINGDAPWDMRVLDSAVYRRILLHGSLGLGEAYMDGLWEADRLDEFFYRLLRRDLNEKIHGWDRWYLLGAFLHQLLFNPQSRERAFQVGERHYDIGNDVFEAMLDPTMSYSCAYWAKADNLADAQRHKLELICRKLALRPGERLLDIGCGWGGLAHHAATHHGVNVVGITVSRQQLDHARRRCADLPVQIEFQDYRKLEGSFDKVVSVGMFEHVGPKNYPVYFDTIHRVLTDQGLFLLHTIGDHATASTTDPWIEKYIFPNGKLPSARQLTDVLERRFVIEDWHNFGPDYDRTLMAWWANFDASWPRLRNRYDSRFYRLWKYYLLSCAGFFRARQGQLWQLVLSKRQRSSVYRSVR
ncbi:MAG: cyclopropane fatty acyl phospholipid synthase [Candidatus Competibacteraceae bacterium]|nr:cyclopropane fatty acyl phospholipid synthase [Candidatus Competibacteraceae bacterium]